MLNYFAIVYVLIYTYRLYSTQKTKHDAFVYRVSIFSNRKCQQISRAHSQLVGRLKAAKEESQRPERPERRGRRLQATRTTERAARALGAAHRRTLVTGLK